MRIYIFERFSPRVWVNGIFHFRWMRVMLHDFSEDLVIEGVIMISQYSCWAGQFFYFKTLSQNFK